MLYVRFNIVLFIGSATGASEWTNQALLCHLLVTDEPFGTTGRGGSRITSS